MTFALFACSEETETDFIIVNNDELGLKNEKVYFSDIVEYLSKNLPSFIDANTKWVHISKGVKPKTLVYEFLLTQRVIGDFTMEDIQKLKEKQTTQVRNYYCTSPGTKFIRENKITSEYRYYDKNFKYLFSIFTNNFSCN